jgi:hypothetical protein
MSTHPFRAKPLSVGSHPSWVNDWRHIMWFDSPLDAEAARRNDERVVDEDEAREIAVILALTGKPESFRHELT